MKFTCSTAGYYYVSDSPHVAILKSKGFKFKETPSGHWSRSIGGKEIKTLLLKEDEIELELKTLEDLINFADDVGGIVIDGNHIIIYDDYLG